MSFMKLKIKGVELYVPGLLSGVLSASQYFAFHSGSTPCAAPAMGAAIAGYMLISRTTDLALSIYCLHTCQNTYQAKQRFVVALNASLLLNVGIGIGITVALMACTSLPLFATIAIGYASCRLLDATITAILDAAEQHHKNEQSALLPHHVDQPIGVRNIMLNFISTLGFGATGSAAIVGSAMLPGLLATAIATPAVAAAIPALASVSPLALCVVSVAAVGLLLFGADLAICKLTEMAIQPPSAPPTATPITTTNIITV